MEKVKILERKKLKLVNVLTKELRNIQLEQLDDAIKKFANFIDVSQIQTRGPLITKLNGTKISDIGEMTLDYDIMVQLVRKIELKGFVFYNTVVEPHCLYMHYEGVEEEFVYAQSKMNVHIWENDLIETGKEYNIYVENEDNKVTIDVFKPMEIFNETI